MITKYIKVNNKVVLVDKIVYFEPYYDGENSNIFFTLSNDESLIREYESEDACKFDYECILNILRKGEEKNEKESFEIIYDNH